MTYTPNPYALPATTHSYLARAAESLSEAIDGRPTCRPATPAPTSPRSGPPRRCWPPAPTRRPTRGRRQKNAWVLLAEVAPELAEWATFFAAGAAKRAAAEAGSTRAVTEREADDLLRDADRFLGVVEQSPGAGAAPAATPAVSVCPVMCPVISPAAPAEAGPWTPSSTSASRPATPSSTAPPTRTSWSSGPPSRRWTPWR